MDILFNLLTYKSHFTAQFPYNLNWGIKKKKPISSFLEKNPIVFADIGARGGIPKELDDLKPFLACYLFEADPEECRKLEQNPPKSVKSFSVFPYFVGGQKGKIDFHLYHHPATSSIFNPDPRFLKYFTSPDFHVEKTIKVKSSTLDEIINLEKISYPDMIKLDTQGSELEILKSSHSAVSNALLMQIEVEFVPIYEGQPLFYDVSRFMYENGFELLYLNRTFGQRTVYGGTSRGQIIFADALFGKREDALGGISIERIAKYAALLINYGHVDFAYHLSTLFPGISQVMPGISAYFRNPKHRKLRSMKNFFIKQLDKLIFLLLHLRRTNSDNQDADTSWPSR